MFRAVDCQIRNPMISRHKCIEDRVHVVGRTMEAC